MKYHGDATTASIGKTTEAISINYIGNVDYLVFLHRDIPTNPATIANEGGNQHAFLMDTGMAPVVKYFAPGHTKPVYAKHYNEFNFKALNTELDKTIVPPNPNPIQNHYNNDKNISLLWTCVKGTYHADLVFSVKPAEPRASNLDPKREYQYQIWGDQVKQNLKKSDGTWEKVDIVPYHKEPDYVRDGTNLLPDNHQFGNAKPYDYICMEPGKVEQDINEFWISPQNLAKPDIKKHWLIYGNSEFQA